MTESELLLQQVLRRTTVTLTGREQPRIEDLALVSGSVSFIGSRHLPGMLDCAILRSPHPHARIVNIDVRRAIALPGVVAVVSGADAQRWTQPEPSLPPGWGDYCLATARVRFVGEPVAAVAAVDRYVAEDALELIDVDYEPLPSVVDPAASVQGATLPLYPEHATNVIQRHHFVWGAVDAAFDGSFHVVEEKLRWNRIGANPLETFGVIAQWDRAAEAVHCIGAFQTPGLMADGRAYVFGLPAGRVRLESVPHGGSFGGKGGSRGTDIAILLSRTAGGRPVRWIEDRREYLVGGAGQAWDRHYTGALAVDHDGIFRGFKVRLIDDLGANMETVGAISCLKPMAVFTGPYAIPAAAYDLTLVASNRAPTASYRGMGPPPHFALLERLVDRAAERLCLDPAEIRRRNFIPADQFPYEIVSGNVYDSGRYAACLEQLLERANYPLRRAEQAAALAQERLVGIGIATVLEPGVFDWNAYAALGMPQIGVAEGIWVSIRPPFLIVATVGFALEGQGQYTVIAQILADYFVRPIEDIEVRCADTLSSPPHFGPGGSRLGVAISSAALLACEKIKQKLLSVAAHVANLDPSNLGWSEGRVVYPPGRPGPTVAELIDLLYNKCHLLPVGCEPGLASMGCWTAPDRTPFDSSGRCKSYLTTAVSFHCACVEIDRATGAVSILNYTIVDDCGTRLNPSIVLGMVHGGIAQGIGAAFLEEYRYDSQARPLTTDLTQYQMPFWDIVGVPDVSHLVTPSPFTMTGAKGAGESAIHGTPAALYCAVNNALHQLGKRISVTPMTPERIWAAIHAAEPESA